MGGAAAQQSSKRCLDVRHEGYRCYLGERRGAGVRVSFPPHELPLTPGGNAFVDGGIFANNPSTAALAALLGSRLTAERNIPLSGVYLLSVGTGFRASSYPPPGALFPYGVLGWLRPRQDDGAPAFPLVDTVFDGTSQINDVT